MFNSFSFSMAESLSSEKKTKKYNKKSQNWSSSMSIFGRNDPRGAQKKKNRKIGGYQKTRRRRCCPRAGTS